MGTDEEFTAAKDRARATWDAGDFGAIASLITIVGEDIVARASVTDADEVLDVACGTGNATLPAARCGARVHGLDIAPRLLDEARERAASAGLEIDFVLGDAEELPWADGTFDVVLSTFGCMFAPRHEVTAAEIARVMKPGGRLGLCCWTPDGDVGALFRTIAAHLPPPPEWFRPPPLWGLPEHVAGLFAGTGVEPRFERTSVGFAFASPAAAVATYEEKFGPVVMARAALQDEASRQALHDDLLEFFTEHGSIDAEGRTVSTADYLVITGEKQD